MGAISGKVFSYCAPPIPPPQLALPKGQGPFLSSGNWRFFHLHLVLQRECSALAWPLTRLALAFREGPSGVNLPVPEIKIELLAQQGRGPKWEEGAQGSQD